MPNPIQRAFWLDLVAELPPLDGAGQLQPQLCSFCVHAYAVEFELQGCEHEDHQEATPPPGMVGDCRQFRPQFPLIAARGHWAAGVAQYKEYAER